MQFSVEILGPSRDGLDVGFPVILKSEGLLANMPKAIA